ncbi:MAG TPA: hypothetical protein VF169_21580 [Albitalea sp.]|uniref:hypothetical protein n=1 Tax=Piscinibacter sp. TaxID=1903157 RepID=UPI002ED14DA4
MSAVSRVPDAARGALRAQQLLEAMRRGKAPPGELFAQMRLAIVEEHPVYGDAFARQIEKALQVRAGHE